MTGASRTQIDQSKYQFILVKQSLQRNVAVVYLSSLCWQRVHFTPIRTKSRLIMTKHIVLRQLFIPGIFLLECHLPLDWPSYTCPVLPRDGPTCPDGRRTLCPHRVSSLRRRGTPGCVCGAPMDVPVGTAISFSGFGMPSISPSEIFWLAQILFNLDFWL